jgi:hypothetical protein
MHSIRLQGAWSTYFVFYLDVTRFSATDFGTFGMLRMSISRNNCSPFSPCLLAQVETQQQRGIRRRCLVFEASGFSKGVVQKENVEDMSVSCKGKRPVETKINQAKLQSRVPRGIGLHLNALAATPKGKIICQDTTASLVPASTSEHGMHGKLLMAGENFARSSGELLELPIYDSEGFPVNGLVSSQSGSPQKKRFVCASDYFQWLTVFHCT